MLVFVFNYIGIWVKDDGHGKMFYDGFNSSEIEEEYDKMTYERIIEEFSNCYGSKPKTVYAFDEDEPLEKGLILLRDSNHCKKVFDYFDCLGREEVSLFADHEMDPMPEITPLRMFEEEVDRGDLEDVHGLRIATDGEDNPKEKTTGVEDASLAKVDAIQETDDNPNTLDTGIEDVSLGQADDNPNTIDTEIEDAQVDIGLEDAQVDTEIDDAHAEEGLTVGEGADHYEVLGTEDEDDDDESDTDSSLYSDVQSDGDDELVEEGPVLDSTELGEQGKFELGLTFAGAKECREAINTYAVNFGYKLKFVKNEPKRIRVICISEKTCPFVMFASKDGEAEGLVIKTLIAQHTCSRQREVSGASQAYLANYFKEALYRNPKFSSRDMQGQVKQNLKVRVSLIKCKRAKRLILTKLKGSYGEEFNMLCGYIEKVKETNPGTKMELQLNRDELANGRRVFKRLFVCFDACKKNWLGGCRPLISLDGCHLKGVTFGVLLTAVGKDANDGIIPIAWAVVNKENKHNWNWFIGWLKCELELGDGSRITIMSDMQKGLMEAVKDQIPQAEHRWCARHIYANWSKKWRGEELKKRFWLAAWSSFEEEYKLNLSKISMIKKQAAIDLLQYPPQNWCGAYQSVRCCIHMVDNNISESFNSSIIEARHKPIISMLEDIRVLAMTRIRDRRCSVNGWKSDWSPASLKLFEDAKSDAMTCNVIWNGEDGYEIGEYEDKHTVSLDSKKCTCRMWELTGVPCCHALAALFYSKLEPLSVMSSWYHKSTFQRSYSHSIKPVPGCKFWKVKESDGVEPPPVEKKIGRPKKLRVRAPNEPKKGSKLSRTGQVQRCSICKSASHKKGHCPQRPSQMTQGTQGSSSSVPSKLKKKRSSKGIGLYINPDSGRTILNPGMSQSVVIDEGRSLDPEPNTRFAIPDESQLRKEKRKQGQTVGEQSKLRKVASKPFKAPRGKGKHEDEQVVLRRSPRGKNVASTVGSTTTS